MAFECMEIKYCSGVDDYRMEFLCDTDADFANLPKCCAGSTAVSAATGAIRVVNASGEWVPFGG